MNLKKSLNKIVTLIALTFTSASVFAEKDSVIVIKITDISQLPKNLKVVKQSELTNATSTTTVQIDSSRFIKRTIKDNSEKPIAAANLQVNKSVYGSYTDYIIDYVKNYHKNHGSRIARIQSNNKGYFRLIDNIMKRYSVPREMKSLAIIESAMNCNAVSPVGAVGPWQFMAGTAKMLGLRVDESIDERRDFYKSTNAAARYLKQLHGMFHDWLLVIAAYNSGPAPVLRAINSGMGRSFWDIKKKLPGETQNHVMAFIATTAYLDRFSNVLAMGGIPKEAKVPKADFSAFKNSFNNNSNSDSDIEDKEDDQKPMFSQSELDQMAVLKVLGPYNLDVIAKILDEDAIRLKRWNPTFEEEIKKTSTPIHLRLPISKIEKFIISRDQILKESKKG